MKNFIGTKHFMSIAVIAALFAGCDGNCMAETIKNNPAKKTANVKKTAETKKAEQKGVWMTNFELAKSQAKINNKPIIMVFEGSDWCHWCMKLEKEVLSQKTFTEWAAKNAILLKVDFPQANTQSNELKFQNRELQKSYKVEGYPTVVLINADGKVLGTTGYAPGGAEKYIKHLNELLKK